MDRWHIVLLSCVVVMIVMTTISITMYVSREQCPDVSKEIDELNADHAAALARSNDAWKSAWEEREKQFSALLTKLDDIDAAHDVDVKKLDEKKNDIVNNIVNTSGGDIEELAGEFAKEFSLEVKK